MYTVTEIGKNRIQDFDVYQGVNNLPAGRFDGAAVVTTGPTLVVTTGAAVVVTTGASVVVTTGASVVVTTGATVHVVLR